MFTAKSRVLKVDQINHNKYRVSDGQNSIIVEKKPYNLTIRFGKYTIQQQEDGFDVYITTPWTQIGCYEFSDMNTQYFQTVNPCSSRELQYTMPIQKKILPAQVTQNPALYVQAQQDGAYINLLSDDTRNLMPANYINTTDDWDKQTLTTNDNYDATIQNYYTTSAIKSDQNIYDGCATETVPQIYSPFDYYRYTVPVAGENNIQQNSYRQQQFSSLSEMLKQ